MTINIDDFWFEKKHITTSRYISNNAKSAPCQNTTAVDTQDAPQFYDIFTNQKEEYIFVPAYREDEWKTHLNNTNFKCVSTNSIDHKPLNWLPANQPLCFFYRELKTLENFSEDNKHKLVFMTVFYNETNEELERFFAFYRTQGVEKFYMYYNGDTSARFEPLPIYKDVEYIEWNFGYWLWNSKNPRHHAQVPALNAFVQKYKYTFKYAILGDIDEYILCAGFSSIKEFLTKTDVTKSLFTHHHYSNVDHNLNIITYETRSTHHGLFRGKTIIFSGDVKPNSAIGVHQSLDAALSPRLRMYHHKPAALQSAQTSTINFAY